MGKREDLAEEAAARVAAREARIKRVGELRDKGWTIEAIARGVGISVPTVKRFLFLEHARKVAAGKA